MNAKPFPSLARWVVVAALVALAMTGPALAKKFPPCPDGEYPAIDPLSGGSATLAIVGSVKPNQVTYTGCGTATGKVKGSKSKGTKVTATFSGCPGLGFDRKVKFIATIAPTCDGAVVTKLKQTQARTVPPTGPVSFAQTIRPMLERGCASTAGCHSGSSPQDALDLTGAKSYDALVNVPSLHRPSALLVKPGDPKASYCLEKVLGSPGIVGAKMPLTGSLTPGQVKALTDWISQGALNN